MLIRQKRSKKSQQEWNLNRENSTEGKKRKAESENLQASIQGGLSDLVRQSPNRVPDDEQVDTYFANLQEQAPEPKAVTTLNPKIVKRYVMRGGKLCQIN